MADLRSWGIDQGFSDIAGTWHEADGQTLALLAKEVGVNDGPPPGSGLDNPVWVIAQGERPEGGEGWTVRTEDGKEISGRGQLPGDLPLGYHELLVDERDPVMLIVSPRRCYRPLSLRSWMWMVQIYALRSSESWGMGDLADLRHFLEEASAPEGGMAMVNPLHAPLPIQPQQDSPYSPSSRIWRNPLYVRVEEVPGAEMLGEDLDRLARQGRALSEGRLVDRTAIWAAKSESLEAIFALAGADESFDAWQAAKGQGLVDYATFCVLTEHYGRPWSQWPGGYRHPHGSEVAEFRAANADRIRYHAWLQWIVERQLSEAGERAPIVTDLAVGADPDGADAWVWQECFAHGVRIGAPPDSFTALGQDWGLVPFNPWQLRMARFAPFIEAVRSNLFAAGGIRIDHVMGLWRQWWIPLGSRASEGMYVRFPVSEMLDIIALESVRAGAVVIGEDLGTVEPGVREQLAQREILSSKVAMFERSHPSEWPEGSLGTIGTHDLPTLVGLISGEDLEAQRRVGVKSDEASSLEAIDRIAKWTGATDPQEVARSFAALLAGSPCALVGMSIEDALGVSERPNIPGTTDEWPNWRLALPMPLEAILEDDGLRSVARVLKERDTHT